MSAAYLLSERELAVRLVKLAEAVEWAGSERLACIMANDGRGLQRAYRAQREFQSQACGLRAMLHAVRAEAMA